jgi:putative restriction endonuclease
MAIPMTEDTNEQIRVAAGLAIQSMIRAKGDNVFTWAEIDQGFQVNGEKIHFATKARGIFKPRQLADGAALSIKQVNPSRPGRAAPYDDKELEDGVVSYRLQKGGDDSSSNPLLEAAFRTQKPLIFFRGLADGLYEAFHPVYMETFSYESGETTIVFEAPSAAVDDRNLVSEIPVSYGVGLRRTRRHQQAFRQRVLMAYGLRCALTNLPLVQLLEAAHIVADSKGGVASVQNGIAMSSFHHVAYENNLMGIDPDGKVILSEQVRGTRDGPMFSHGLLELDGRRMRFPTESIHHPRRDFLAMKFEEFQKAAF